MRKTLFRKNTQPPPRRSPDHSTPNSLENQDSTDMSFDPSIFVYILLGFFVLLGLYNLIF